MNRPRHYRTHPQDVGPMFDMAPPSAPEAEAALIGSLIIDPSEVDAVRPLVPSGDVLSTLEGSEVLEALLSVYGDSPGSHDLPRILDRLRVRGAFSEKWPDEDEWNTRVRGLLVAYAESVPSSAGARYYARIVAEKHRLRTIAASCQDILYRVYHAPADDNTDLIAGCLEDMARVASESTLSDFADAADDLNAVISDDEPDEVIPTGFSDWDRLFDGGFRPGELHILAGRPGSGKTSLGIRVAENVAAKGCAVAIASLEMSRKAYARRRLSTESGVELQAIRRKSYSDNEYARLLRATAEMERRPVRIIEAHGYDSESLATSIAGEARNHGVKLLVVDYLQKLNAPSSANAQNREREVAIVCGTLKRIAVQNNMAVLALAQPNRQVENSERPQMSHLRESGAIEQDADSISFIHRTEGSVELLVIKQRDGAIGDIPLGWDARHATFTDIPYQFGGAA